MRTDSNRKVHKIKRDPFKSMLRFAGILAIVVVVGIGLTYLCATLITNDYIAKRDDIQQQNAENEVAFNEKMNALRNANNVTVDAETGEVTSENLPSWERDINGTIWRVEDEGNAGLENTSTISLDRAALMQGGLMLVNAWHAMPIDFSEEGLVSVGTESGFSIQVQDNTVQLFRPAYDALSAALTAAKEEAGLEHYIVRRGYRSYAEQSELFNKEMNDLSERYSGNLLIEETKKKVNYPGTSDYQTGMSFRMDIYEKGNSELNNMKFQAESPQAAWLTENCWRFGIVFRFPTRDFPNSSWQDKSHITGVSGQLNLYRYVGKAHAAAMKVMDMCLEEYIEFLIAHPHICIYENSALRYEIVRIGGADEMLSFQLPLPNPASDYQASLDNMGGIVMAYVYQ